eukprot:CAMPEP_0167741626 /NCGR_PEP_ID=MMETSP0110_2-20121227/964_1 /TAXON_ID=629695 /ORGANISM="Gymnochlora sp., Strain CCMP2014" /LENGTH=86 /DNA_ID=CAMNT_0007625705 /DNA_START=783 /DNA_END=1039 /DNA_ORIENTATION=-
MESELTARNVESVKTSPVNQSEMKSTLHGVELENFRSRRKSQLPESLLQLCRANPNFDPKFVEFESEESVRMMTQKRNFILTASIT